MPTTTKTRTKARKRREKWHGTYTGYLNHKCRCRHCKAAWAEYQKEYRVRRLGNATCKLEKCKNPAWPSAGNGLCYGHTLKLRELRARKRKRRSRAAA